jgi:hypothetical protein
LVPKSILGFNGASPLTVEIILEYNKWKIVFFPKGPFYWVYPLIYTISTTKRNNHINDSK